MNGVYLSSLPTLKTPLSKCQPLGTKSKQGCHTFTAYLLPRASYFKGKVAFLECSHFLLMKSKPKAVILLDTNYPDDRTLDKGWMSTFGNRTGPRVGEQESTANAIGPTSPVYHKSKANPCRHFPAQYPSLKLTLRCTWSTARLLSSLPL